MKQFLIVGSIGAVIYANVFPYIKSREVHYRPEYYGIKEYDNTDVKVTATWYTTMETPYIPPLELTKSYNPDDYPKYDNYDAIEVSKTKNIPYDYQGVMGVPITFLDKYCPEQFEIVSASGFCCDDIEGWKGVSEEFYKMYYEQGNKGHISVGWSLPHYVENNKAVIPYKRIFIKRK